MFSPDQYELLDFGGGRKLERFAALVIDRPSPAADGVPRRDAARWPKGDARFELNASSTTGPNRGRWIFNRSGEIESWSVRCGAFLLSLKPTDFGHLGIFPEQAAQWNWIEERIHCHNSESPPEVLNLFAYTGGSTLAAAAAGGAVTHVDAAKNVVAWARRNAQLSKLQTAAIRWIADDALKFVRREVKRGRRYDAVILDPPAYGHGPGGEVWRLERDLLELLRLCRELTGPTPRFILLTSHAEEFSGERLAECMVAAGWTELHGAIETGQLMLTARDGRELPSGTFARVGRWPDR